MTWEPFGKAFVVPARLRVVFIEAEAIIGLWLLIGAYPRLLWSVALAFFTSLSAISLTLAVNGEASCGCFGAATVNPYTTLALDIAAVAALLVTWPGRRAEADPDFWRRVEVASWAAVGSLAIAAIATISHGGVAQAYTDLLGDVVSVEPSTVEVAGCEPGDLCPFTVTLHNNLGRPVRVVGGTDNCGCHVTDRLPLTLEPGGAAEVTGVVFAPKRPGRSRGSSCSTTMSA